LPFVFAALMGAFAVVYAFVRHDGSLLARVFFKCAASVMFVLLAVSVRTGAPGGYYVLILCGLCASLAGDAVLLFTDRGDGFVLAGMAAFAAAHGFYIAAFWTIASPSWVDAVFFAALMTLGASLLRAKRVKAGRSAAALWVYIALLCAMAARAISMLWVPGMPVIFGACAAAGGVMFAASDLLLGIEQQTGSRAAGSLSTIAYYLAQGLLAFTVMLIPG
jgi:uncharacterized membrane protein YhhN